MAATMKDTLKNIKWHLPIIAALGTTVFLLLALTVFVTYYAMLVDTERQPIFYDHFALRTAGPFVFCFAPFPVYMITRWLCEKAQTKPFTHALLFFFFYQTIDVTMLLSSEAPGVFFQAIHLINSAALLLAILVGAYFSFMAQKKS